MRGVDRLVLLCLEIVVRKFLISLYTCMWGPMCVYVETSQGIPIIAILSPEVDGSSLTFPHLVVPSAVIL